jgi:hypothetical protein
VLLRPRTFARSLFNSLAMRVYPVPAAQRSNAPDDGRLGWIDLQLDVRAFPVGTQNLDVAESEHPPSGNVARRFRFLPSNDRDGARRGP